MLRPLLLVLVTLSFTEAQRVAQYRVNCGGAEVADFEGNVWQADDFFSGGLVFKVPMKDIAESNFDVLYASERWDKKALPELKYTLPVEVGSYLVRLYFAEASIHVTEIGQRTFDIRVNDQLLEHFDVLAYVPVDTALVAEFPVSTSSGNIEIELLHRKVNLGTGST